MAETPRLGRRCGFRRPSLRRVRRWPVKGFANGLIFYLPLRDGVEILHVLHGARHRTPARRVAPKRVRRSLSTGEVPVTLAYRVGDQVIEIVGVLHKA